MSEKEKNSKKSTSVTIGVITYNSEHVLPRFFEGLSLANYPFQLIVVDNASREQPALARRLSGWFSGHDIDFGSMPLKYIPNSHNLMYTAAANQCLDMSDGDITILMNPDCWGIDRGWLKQMVKTYEEHVPDVAGFKLVREDGTTLEHVGARSPGVHLGKGEKDDGQYDKLRVLESDNEYVTGACWLIPRKTRDKYGLLPTEHVHYASDREYCRHVRREGGKVWYFPIRMVHLFGKSSK